MDNHGQLWKQDVRRSLALRLGHVLLGKRSRKVENKLLQSSLGAKLRQPCLANAPGPLSDWFPALLTLKPFISTSGGIRSGCSTKGGTLRPVHGYAIADRLRVALDAGETNLILGFFRYCMDVVALFARVS